MNSRVRFICLSVAARCWLVLSLVPGGALQAAEPEVVEAMINAPVADVWRVFTTAEGQRALGATDASVELKVSGCIRTQQSASEAAPATREREILAYEPERMLATRIVALPADYPDREQALESWTVTYFASIAGETTHVRVVTMGRDDSANAVAARKAIAADARASLEELTRQHRPNCKLCEKPK